MMIFSEFYNGTNDPLILPKWQERKQNFVTPLTPVTIHQPTFDRISKQSNKERGTAGS